MSHPALESDRNEDELPTVGCRVINCFLSKHQTGDVKEEQNPQTALDVEIHLGGIQEPLGKYKHNLVYLDRQAHMRVGQFMLRCLMLYVMFNDHRIWIIKLWVYCGCDCPREVAALLNSEF